MIDEAISKERVHTLVAYFCFLKVFFIFHFFNKITSSFTTQHHVSTLLSKDKNIFWSFSLSLDTLFIDKIIETQVHQDQDNIHQGYIVGNKKSLLFLYSDNVDKK